MAGSRALNERRGFNGKYECSIAGFGYLDPLCFVATALAAATSAAILPTSSFVSVLPTFTAAVDWHR